MTVKTYDALPLNLKETARYARCTPEALTNDFSECLAECRRAFTYRACYEVFPLSAAGDALDFGFTVIRSADLARNLRGCASAIVFAATVGMGIDVLIRRYSLLSPAKSLVCQAAGSAAVETLCDALCRDLPDEYGELRPRFSPGYGDLPLETQRDIFRALAPERALGLTLGASLLMTPTKSVTAFTGIRDPR